MYNIYIYIYINTILYIVTTYDIQSAISTQGYPKWLSEF